MDESRLLRSLRRVDDLGEPDPAFLDRLYDDAIAEIGLAETARPATERIGPPRPVLRLLRGKRTRWPLLLVAAIVAGGALAALGVGALRQPAVTEQADLLTHIQATGRITIAIRPDHPQFAMAGQVATGFDVDVAAELARRLGVSANVVVEPPDQMLSAPQTDAWQIAFPSIASWTIPTPQFVVSRPYYYWPHLVVVPDASSTTALSDLGAGAICAVSGDGGEAWLRGNYGGESPPGLRQPIVTRPNDDDCLAMLSAGDAVAIVTADLTSGDVQARGGFRAIGGPGAEPRVVALERSNAAGSDPSSLLTAIDAAFDAMRRDGTLTRLSQNRFGADLTSP